MKMTIYYVSTACANQSNKSTLYFRNSTPLARRIPFNVDSQPSAQSAAAGAGDTRSVIQCRRK